LKIGFNKIKIFIICLALIIVLSIIGINIYNGRKLSEMGADKEVIKNLYIELCDASINKDMDLLNDILSDDYVLVHMTGMKQSKKEYMESVKTGELEYFESIHESIEVNIDGDYATIIGKTKTLASPFHSSKSWWRLRQDLEAKKIDGKWMLTYSKASTY